MSMPIHGLKTRHVLTITSVLLCVTVHEASAAAARLSTALTGVTVVEVCNRELLNVSCGRDEIVYVERALYGRMQLGRCVKQDLGYLGCEVDVTAYICAKCTGRPTCNMRVPDDTLHDYKPCPIDTTSYLQLSHRCVPVLTASANECVLDKSLRRQVTFPGYISSHVSTIGGDLGSSRCPWRLQAAEGRRLRLTIEVFTTSSPDSSSHSAGGLGLDQGQGNGQLQARGIVNRAAGCFDVATVTEGGKATRVLSCQISQRLQNELHVSSGQRETWTSTGNALTVELMLDELRSHNAGLIIKYEGVGCTRLVLPAGMWARVEGDVTSVYCNATHETWTVHCQDSRWTGLLGNCSLVPSSKWILNSILLGESEASFPYGILIAVSVGVALGVFLGGFLLALVSLHLKRKRTPPKHEQSVYERALRVNQQADLETVTPDQCDHVIYGQTTLTLDNMIDPIKVATHSNYRSTPNLVYSSGTPVRTGCGTVPRSLIVTGYSTPQSRHAMTLSGDGRYGPSSNDEMTRHEHCPLTITDHFQLSDHRTLHSDFSTFHTAKRHPRGLQ